MIHKTFLTPGPGWLSPVCSLLNDFFTSRYEFINDYDSYYDSWTMSSFQIGASEIALSEIGESDWLTPI